MNWKCHYCGGELTVGMDCKNSRCPTKLRAATAAQPYIHRLSNKRETMCGDAAFTPVPVTTDESKVTCAKCLAIGPAPIASHPYKAPTGHPYSVEDCPKPVQFNGRSVCGCQGTPTNVPGYSDEQRRQVEELREVLDPHRFARRLADAYIANAISETRAEALVPLVKARDQAMLGAVYHACPQCGCCWLEKPGDAEAKRCSCCKVVEDRTNERNTAVEAIATFLKATQGTSFKGEAFEDALADMKELVQAYCSGCRTRSTDTTQHTCVWKEG